jgi:hypothetical protein
MTWFVLLFLLQGGAKLPPKNFHQLLSNTPHKVPEVSPLIAEIPLWVLNQHKFIFTTQLVVSYVNRSWGLPICQGAPGYSYKTGHSPLQRSDGLQRPSQRSEEWPNNSTALRRVAKQLHSAQKSDQTTPQRSEEWPNNSSALRRVAKKLHSAQKSGQTTPQRSEE